MIASFLLLLLLLDGFFNLDFLFSLVSSNDRFLREEEEEEEKEGIEEKIKSLQLELNGNREWKFRFVRVEC